MLEVAQIASLVLHHLATAGLRPNMQKGKTEMLLDLRGEGAVQARRCLSEKEYEFQLSTSLVEDDLMVTQYYKHLGVFIELGGSPARDVRSKMAIARDTMTRYRSQLFANRALPLTKKVQLFQSLILNAVIFGSPLWRSATMKQWRQIEHGFSRLYKRLCVNHFGKSAVEWSNDRILTTLELPSAEEVLRLSRLRYLGQLVISGQPHVWALIQEEVKWWCLVQEDLQWWRQFCPEDDMPLGESNEWDELVQSISSHPGVWKRRLKKAIRRAVAFRRRCFEWNEWHRWTFQYLQEHGAIGNEVVPPKPTEWFCLCCARQFQSAAAQAVHAFKKHDRKQAARYFVTGTQCEICLKHYSTYVNLFNRVKRSNACLEAYLKKTVVVDPEPGVNSRIATGFRQSARDPFFQAAGPKEATLHEQGGDPHYRDESARLQEKWIETCRPLPCSAEDWLEKLRIATNSTYLNPSEIRHAFDDWVEAVDLESLGFTIGWLSACDSFRKRFCFCWFTNGGAPTASAERAHEFFAKQSTSLEPFDFVRYRTPVYRPVVFAHLFSGRRRENDVQACLETLGHLAISIDIIFHPTKGDLCQPDTFNLFARALHDGFLSGFIGGPPCETWSRARGALEGNKADPRVIRSLQFPGKPELTPKDRQISWSKLLGELRLMVIALVTRATGVMEHPAEDDVSPYTVSVWRTEFIKVLLRFPRCFKHRVCQGHYGAKAVKPTDLLIVNGTNECSQLLLDARNTSLPRKGVIGLDENRKWRTAILKEYPSQFCTVIAQIFSRSQIPDDVQMALPEEFLAEITPLLAEFDMSAEMGADYGNRP